MGKENEMLGLERRNKTTLKAKLGCCTFGFEAAVLYRGFE